MRRLSVVDEKDTSQVIDMPGFSDKNHQLLVKALNKRTICTHIAETPITSCRLGQKRALVFNTALPATTYPAGWLAQDKYLQKLWLIDHDIPTPRGKLINCEHTTVLNNLTWPYSFPVVLKPVIGQFGDFVFLDINSKTELTERIEQSYLSRQLSQAILEEQVSGIHLRIYIDASNNFRVGSYSPPLVLGDGKNSILSLVQIENFKRLNAKNRKNATIKISEMLMSYLAKHFLTLDSVPTLKKPTQLNSVINRGMGGVYTDLTSKVHPSFITTAIKILKIFPGLSAASLEIICENYSAELESQKHWVTEVSTDLGLFLYNRKSNNKNQQPLLDTLATSLLKY